MLFGPNRWASAAALALRWGSLSNQQPISLSLLKLFRMFGACKTQNICACCTALSSNKVAVLSAFENAFGECDRNSKARWRIVANSKLITLKKGWRIVF
jgi:hypothetical protein